MRVGFVAAMLVLIPQSMRGDAPAVGLRVFSEGYVSPVIFVPVPDGSGRFLVGDQTGVVHVVDREGRRAGELFLDLRSRMVPLNQGFDERGLLGLALHPGFNENGRFYVYYSARLRSVAPRDWDHTSHLSEFKVAGGEPLKADAGSERVLMEIDQPYFNHNGGGVEFGPDGYLYVGVGDGGNANDLGRRGPRGNGQDLMTVLGKLLRIDVDGGAPYGIPSDNPFLDPTVARPEIYAYGLRNPWRFSFDRGGGRELWVGDVGQTMYEEVDVVVKGGNYGWNLREGSHGFDPQKPTQPPADAPRTGARGEPLLDPVIEYKNLNGFQNDPEALGISVAGGYVYRGKAIPGLQGKYVFGDWSRSWALAQGVVLVASRPETPGQWKIERMNLSTHPEGHIGEYLLAFGEDAEGELYVLTNGGNTPTGRSGKIYRLLPR
jgi:glucose/arabinose dehydrogenase